MLWEAGQLLSMFTEITGKMIFTFPRGTAVLTGKSFIQRLAKCFIINNGGIIKHSDKLALQPVLS
jgi:hypothetical protein